MPTFSLTEGADVFPGGKPEWINTGQDLVHGLGGNDVIDGGALNDTLNGNAGLDTLKGGAGNDFLNGGVGLDTLDGGADIDTVDYSDKTTGVRLTLTGATEAIAKMGAADEDKVRNVENIVGGSGHDTLVGDGLTNTLRGGAGGDYLDGLGGVDTVDYSDKAAALVLTLDGANFALAYVGGVEEDTVVNMENVIGGSGGDSIVGDAKVNLLRGGAGADYLFSHSFNPDGTIKSGAGNDTLNGEAGNDGLFAGDGADTVNGGDGDDGLVGGGGADTLNGGIGVDFLFGGGFSPAGARLANSGNDTLNSGDGNDGLYGFDGADTINGEAGDDYVEGGAGNDIINGGAGSDFLLGEADNDTINGGLGFDYLYGHAGADTFVFKKGDSADWILDFSAAQGDKVKFEGFGFANFAAIPLVDLSSPGNPAVQLTVLNTTTSTYDQLTIFGATLAQLNAGNVLLA